MFEQFYKKHYPSLLNFAIYLTNSRSDSKEIVNDVFVSVWQKKGKLKIDDSLKSYLFTAVKNRCYNFHSKKRIETTEISDSDKVSSFKADSIVQEKEMQKQLIDILDSLPPKCRQVFVMSRIDGLSYNEIASLLEISSKTVEAQISKALKVFRKKIK
ncbi:MAG: RNA polymerase sigma-70 factor [Bacteroidia bacterium]